MRGSHSRRETSLRRRERASQRSVAASRTSATPATIPTTARAALTRFATPPPVTLAGRGRYHSYMQISREPPSPVTVRHVEPGEIRIGRETHTRNVVVTPDGEVRD